MRIRSKQQIAALSEANEDLKTSLHQRDLSLQDARDENLHLISVLSHLNQATQSLQEHSLSLTDPSQCSLRSELIVCQRQKEELEVCLQSILQDLEKRTPIVTALKRDYDILKQNYDHVMRVWKEQMT